MTNRNTATRDRHRSIIRRGEPPCALCGEPIDYTLRYPDPMSYVVDHIEPLGPNPTPERIAALDVLTNKQAAHNTCNRAKWDTVEGDTAGPRTFITARTW